MKKLFFVVMVMLLSVTIISVLAAPVALAEPVLNIDGTDVTEFSLEVLATVGGATLFVILVVQFLKFPLDRVWKIPTRIVVYGIALITVLTAQWIIAGGITIRVALTAVANAFVVGTTAIKAYETLVKKNE